MDYRKAISRRLRTGWIAIVSSAPNVNPAFTGMSCQVPGTVARHLVAGLKPGSACQASVTVNGGKATVAVVAQAGGPCVADVGGVIGVGFPASASPAIGGAVNGKALIGPGG